jgi:hypothetical protein
MTLFSNQKGQALLIVVLAMVVALTVGLSVVSRSIINLRNSQQQISSQQALSAAEAGVEQTIENGASVGKSNFSSATSYTTSIETISGGGAFLVNGNNPVPKDDAIYIWLTPYSTDSAKLFQDVDSLGKNNRWSGNLNIYWGDSSATCDSAAAAIEVAVIWNTRADPKVTRYAFDPCPDRISSNNFTRASSVGQLISGTTLIYGSKFGVGVPIPIVNGFLVRVVPFYADTYIGVKGDSAAGSPPLPSQGTIITSTGTTDNNVVRKLNVFQGYPEIPAELFPFSVFWP